MAKQKINPAQQPDIKRQNDTTNTAPAGARIETGWGWIQVGGGAVAQVSETVTFNTAFTTLPIVLMTYGGDAGNVAASYGTGGGVALGAAATKASNITTSNFIATITAGSNWPAAQTIYYQWIAIGV